MIAIVVLTLYNLTPALNCFDTEYYILAGQNFLDGKIDCLRTPVYPLLCQTFIKLFGIEGLPTAMTIFQSLIYLISLVSLQHIANYTIKNKTIRFITLTFYILCIAPGWCNEILTESLSISGCVIMADVLCRYINRPSWRLSFGVFILTLLLVFLRPSFIFIFIILPFVWLVLWIRNNQRLIQTLSLFFTMICIAILWVYCRAYEKEYGVFTSSFSFKCDIYNLKRSGVWDIEKVIDPEAKQILQNIDEQWSGNYAPIYNTINSNQNSLQLISSGCNDIRKGSESTLRQHQIIIAFSSFDKRFDAAVNTHTPLSVILFVISLFLALPLSLFYGIVVISCFALIVSIIQRRTIPLIYAILILFTAAQCVGILFYASEAHERLLLPVYPLFVVMLGSAFEKATQFFRSN